MSVGTQLTVKECANNKLYNRQAFWQVKYDYIKDFYKTC